MSLVVALDVGPGLGDGPEAIAESLACVQWLQALVAASARRPNLCDVLTIALALGRP